MSTPEFDKAEALREYIRLKIEMLEEEFFIKLTLEEKLFFHTLSDEFAVDAYARDIFLKKL